MQTMNIHIKNMVCDRCIRVVREELEKLNLTVIDVELGKAIVSLRGLHSSVHKIVRVLEANGFGLVEGRKAQLVERIKALILRLVRSDELGELNVNLSDYIAVNIGKSYHHLSSLFSSVEGLTIGKFFILHKIERAKELLAYEEFTLGEIGYRLGYSSVQHLSNQFKTVTGLAPSHFRKIGTERRKPLDMVNQLGK